ncbi:CrcB family protein [Candidatus Poribacteria bacterium]|nr:CrcB family protein [Candidatus Poribacteria bacterium]
MPKFVVPCLMIAVGGGIGSLARFGLSSWLGGAVGGRFPWGTFAVNIAGAFLLGIVGTMIAERLSGGLEFLRYAVAIGFLGGFTTFSTWEFEAHELFGDGEWLTASINLTASVFLGLIAVRLGVLAARALM